MYNFTYCTPTKVHFGKGQIEKLHDEVVAVGKKVLLVYGGNSIKRSGLYDDVLARLSTAPFTKLQVLSQIHVSTLYVMV